MNTTTSTTHPGSRARRPLKVRDLNLWNRLARALVQRGVTPNTISLLGLGAGLGTGALFAATSLDGASLPVLLVAALLLMVLRGFCNILDGVMAVEEGAATRIGALYNEVPDRLSDVAIMIGAGYAIGSHPLLGWAAALAAVFTAYVRVECHGAGATADYRGLFGKPGRMIVLALCVGVLLLPGGMQWTFPVAGSLQLGVLGVGTALIVAGSLLTSTGRLVRAARELSIPTGANS